MYVSIRRYGLLTREPVKEVLQGVREGFLPIIRDQPGFLAYYSLDSGSGTLTSISIFEHRAGAERSNRIAENWIGKNLTNTLPTSPEIIRSEEHTSELRHANISYAVFCLKKKTSVCTSNVESSCV